MANGYEKCVWLSFTHCLVVAYDTIMLILIPTVVVVKGGGGGGLYWKQNSSSTISFGFSCVDSC